MSKPRLIPRPRMTPGRVSLPDLMRVINKAHPDRFGNKEGSDFPKILATLSDTDLMNDVATILWSAMALKESAMTRIQAEMIAAHDEYEKEISEAVELVKRRTSVVV